MRKSGHRTKTNRTPSDKSRCCRVPTVRFIGQNTGNTQDVDKPVGNCLLCPPSARDQIASGGFALALSRTGD